MKTAALIQTDPELAAAVPAAERDAAARACVAATVQLPRGDWAGWRPEADAEPQGFGLLVLEGLLCRRVAQGAHSGAELLGPGDLLRPWDEVAGWATLPTEASWEVIQPATIAVLDRQFSRRAAPYPGISETLMRRATLRSRYLAILAAIVSQRRLETRLHMLFWHLADRFGRMRGEWVQISLPLTHALLADLVAARRPSVSTALSKLQEQGLLVREVNGWRLSGTVPHEYTELTPGATAEEPRSGLGG
ncbi:MAG: Crp/Fnr family transcriptional regulator [Solirubrobacterales bacterium]